MQFHLEVPSEIQLRESRGLVKDVYDTVSDIREPLSEYDVMLDLIHRIPTLSTAFDIIVDFATYRGYDFIGGTKAERDKLRKIFMRLNFMQVISNVIYQICYYGDSFLEKRRIHTIFPDELYPLETTEMRIDYDIHGEVKGYVQRIFDTKGMSKEQILSEEKRLGVLFSVDDVIHFRLKWIGSQIYSYNPNDSISQSASTYLYASNYLMNIFLNMPPRYLALLSGMSEKEYKLAKVEFQNAKTNYKRAITFSRSNDPNAKLSLQKIEPPYDSTLTDIVKWLTNEILKVTRVPRSWIEESGIENRGVTESEQRPFDVRIQSIQRNVIEPQINRLLVPYYTNDTTVQFRFNEISRKGEKEILMNAGLLRDMGLKPQALVRYLDERGILGLDPDDFTEEQIKKNIELEPSRERMNKSMSDMTQNRNEAGVSDESAKKIEV